MKDFIINLGKRKINLAIGKIIRSLHNLTMVYAVLGCFLPFKYAKYHYLIWPMIYISWIIFDNNCLLTILERKLRGIKYKPIKSSYVEYPLVQEIFKEYFNIKLKGPHVHKVFLFVLNLTWFISLYRHTKFLDFLK